MPTYRHALPQLERGLYLTDAGLETTLVFIDGIELPHFAAFPLLGDADGTARLDRYYRDCIAHARRYGTGFVLESVTWRASRDWAERLGIDRERLAWFNRRAIEQLVRLRDEAAGLPLPMPVSGCIGPRGDGYSAATRMDAAAAEAYHAEQAGWLAATEADLISAITMPYAEEAIGIARAASAAGMPVVISFTVETDGRLPSGEPLGAAIERVDAATGGEVAYYMVNCAHPTHFLDVLTPGAAWLARLRGVRANASTRSHAELDSSTTLDAGDPQDLARWYRQLQARLPGLAVVGGCCGTDHRHVGAIGAACTGRQAA